MNPLRYREELEKAMLFLAADERTLFLGQSVCFPGTAMFTTLTSVPQKKKIELPVAEEMQMGITTGLAIAGFIPVSIFPRWNFLILGLNQLVNHLDKVEIMSKGDFPRKAIIRTGIGSENPLHPQCQHIGDFSHSIQTMCSTIQVIRLMEPEAIVPAYELALNRQDGRSTILVEYGDYYHEK